MSEIQAERERERWDGVSVMFHPWLLSSNKAVMKTIVMSKFSRLVTKAAGLCKHLESLLCVCMGVAAFDVSKRMCV